MTETIIGAIGTIFSAIYQIIGSLIAFFWRDNKVLSIFLLLIVIGFVFWQVRIKRKKLFDFKTFRNILIFYIFLSLFVFLLVIFLSMGY